MALITSELRQVPGAGAPVARAVRRVQVRPRLTAAIPMENPYCSCMLTLVMAYSCNPYGEPPLQLYANTWCCKMARMAESEPAARQTHAGALPPGTQTQDTSLGVLYEPVS